MQRVYGEIIIQGTTSGDDVVQAVKDYEISLGLNSVPEDFVISKLGIKVDGPCTVAVNGRDFSINAKEPLEFGYDSIRITSLVFKTAGINAVVRYMYFRKDKTYQ